MHGNRSMRRNAWLPRLPAVLFLLLTFMLVPIDALLASGDGPRVHKAAPVDVNVLQYHLMSLQDANRSFDPSLITPLAKFDTSIVTLQYLRTVEVKGRFVALMGMLRGGQTRSRELESGYSASSSGLADPFIGVSINLAGLQPMSVDEFRQFTPGTVVNFLIGATLPLGQYDDENVINLGSNRWTFRLGVPVTRSYFADSGKRTTLELIPNLYFFTDNHARNLKQETLFTIEAHVTHDLGARSWGGVGLLYTRGGATTINGIEQNGMQESLSLSASLGWDFSPRWAVHLRYGDTIDQNENGLDGTLYHLKLINRF
jgi:hypothetical protein